MKSSRLVSLRHLRLWGVLAVSPALGNEITLEPPKDDPVRGIVISCQTWGQDRGTDALVEAIRALKTLAATWIHLHPYRALTRQAELLMPPLPAAPAAVWAGPCSAANRETQ